MRVVRDVIVIGASAGGVEALSGLVHGLPADLAATILVVLHVAPTATSALDHILERAGHLRAVMAVDGMKLEHGTIIVSRPDAHLLVDDCFVSLGHGPPERGHRPAVDPLFRSAAKAYGARVVGVVLSGNLDDGAEGLVAITLRGGVAIAQSPDEARYPGMPQAAIARAHPAHVAPVAEIAELLQRLVGADAA